MAGELVASVVVDGLLSKLRSALGSELGRLWGFKDDLEDMKTTLVSVQAVLHDAEKRSFKEESVRLWLKRLKDAAYDIEDMLLDKFQIQKHSKFQVLMPYNVKSCFSIPVMAHKLKGMSKRLDKIAEERSRYNLIKEDAMTDQQVTDGRITFSTVNRADVLGREEEATEIINRLLMSTTEDICIIPIVGIGGLGKTTLAKLIFDDDRIKKVFELRIWVHAMDFKVDKLVEEILSSSRSENMNNLGNLQARVLRVTEILNGRRYLIVLDDVWNEDKQIWEDFKQVLHGGKRESRIIVTTRNERVGLTMCAEMPHKLKPLPDDVCLGLFERRAFGSAGDKDKNLASIGEEIVKKCQGVPLIANSLGGMLYLEKGEAAWEKVKDSDLWKLAEQEGSSENKIISSLKLSYQHMPSPLKLCFVYCSSFPKAFKLEKDMLIQQWIAQRFIQTEDEVEALQIGDRYVNYLLSMSFLEEVEELNWFRYEDIHSFLEEESYSDTLKDVKTYMKMHDLVYDLARWVAGDEVSVLDALESGKDNAMECRYASVIESNGPSKELGKALPPKVRALHFQMCTSLPKGIFSYTKCLRVLDFTRCPLDELPTSIYRLKQLRYLRLEHVDESIGRLGTIERLIISNSRSIRTLPASIGKLHNLKSLPESLVNLVKLVTLKIRNCGSLESLPESLGNLVKLETLTIYECKNIKSLPESLSNLVNLKTLTIGKLSNTTLPVSIWKLHNLIDLDLSFSGELLELPDSIGGLQKVNSLKLYGCHSLRSLPGSLDNLTELRTLDIRGCAMLDQDELPTATCNMRHLNIQRDEPTELLEFDMSELELHLVNGDPEKGHVVRHVTDAKRINLKERGGSIKSLTYKCGDYHKKGRLVEAMLEALQPHQNLQELWIFEYGGSMFPSWMRNQMESFLPNLVKIRLEGISNCEHLPVLGQLPKLEEMVISYMRKLRRISEEEVCGARNTTAVASFPSLKRLELQNMDWLEEWVTAAMAGDDGERGASIFPCLEDLTIWRCSKLETIRPCIPPSVRRLSLSFNNHLSLRFFLHVLEIPLLKHLAIYDYGMYSFAESIRCLTSLESLELRGCKSLTTFPEWLGELSQLQHLVLEDCLLIDRLPQSIQGLTALKRLHISGCGESLLERTRKEIGEDWDKISHIGKIEITREVNWYPTKRNG